MANSSIRIWERVSADDIIFLRQTGARVAVAFDATHPRAVKPVHFDITVEISLIEAQRLLNAQMCKTYYKFGFGRSSAGLGVHRKAFKFECAFFSEDMVRRANKHRAIRAERARIVENLRASTDDSGDRESTRGMIRDITY